MSHILFVSNKALNPYENLNLFAKHDVENNM